MGIKRFFNEDIIVRRLRDVSGSDVKSSFQATATADGHIQELDQQARQLAGITEEKAWMAWFGEDADINEGDKVTDESGVEYHVREVVVKDYGINRHKQCILVEFND